MSSDAYKTIHAPVEYEFKVKGSRFIGVAVPAQSKIGAEQIIVERRKKYFDATHHCYAYRIGFGRDECFRYSDAGEPVGTAGKPIYAVILGHTLTNIVIIVTRYFGGTKLGTGGLARAYGSTAAAVIALAQIKTEYLTKTVTLQFPYEFLNAVMNLIERSNASVLQSHYGESVRIKMAVRLHHKLTVINQLMEQTGGKIVITEEN